MSYPAGGYLLWVELPIEVDTVKLNKRLDEYNISVAPGVIFSASGKYRNCMRLSFAKKIDETMKQALRLVAVEAQKLIDEA